MKIKELLKKNKRIRKIVKNFKIKHEMLIDYKKFKDNYIENYSLQSQIEYDLMLMIHSLEKGMCHKDLRPFGEKKVSHILLGLKELEKYDLNLSGFVAKMSMGILLKWKTIYDNNSWTKSEVYDNVKSYLENKQSDVFDVGSLEYSKKNFEKYRDFDYLNAISTRHSVRDFLKKEISKDDINYCVSAALLTPTACNRQMVKIYSIKNDNYKNVIKSVLLGLSGFNKDSVNFFVITYDLSAFSFYGERNQGMLNAGLVAMNFVNALHFKGIGSCFLQWGNGNKIEDTVKEELNIPKNERIAIVIGAGYYKDEYLVPKSIRKMVEDIYIER